VTKKHTQKYFGIKIDVQSCFVYVARNPTRVWDTFAEPNNINNTECSFRTKSGFTPPRLVGTGPRPKSRLTEEGCGRRQLKTCLLWGSETPHQTQWAFYFSRRNKIKTPDESFHLHRASCYQMR